MATRQIKQKVGLDEVYFDEELYPRTGSNWQTVYDYAESMKTGAKFPPIILALFNRQKYLVDGKHRLEAYKNLKLKKIDAIVFTGWNKKKIYEEAIRYNIEHGRVLSPYEKRLIAMKLRKMKYPNNQISDLIQVPQNKLQHFIGQRLVSSTTGHDFIVVKSLSKHLGGTSLSKTDIKKIEDEQKCHSMNNQFDLFQQVVSVLESGLLDVENNKLMNLVVKTKTLLRKY